MAKGPITQTLVILLRAPITLDEVKNLLPSYHVISEVPRSDLWEFGGPTVTMEYQKEVDGVVLVDIVDKPWPDDMGHPVHSPVLHSAWTAGWMGPFTFPNALYRSMEHSVWPQARETVPLHTGFLRLRVSYAFGTTSDPKMFPDNYDAIAELAFITQMACYLLMHPSALCLFNPNGEMVLPISMMEQFIKASNLHNSIPIQLWSNDRYFASVPNWVVVDCVGNAQFDLPDYEMVYPTGQFAPSEVAQMLRMITWYELKNGGIIKDGDTMSGPKGSRWLGRASRNLYDPPREVIRWFPLNAENIPTSLQLQQQKTSLAPAPVEVSTQVPPPLPTAPWAT